MSVEPSSPTRRTVLLAGGGVVLAAAVGVAVTRAGGGAASAKGAHAGGAAAAGQTGSPLPLPPSVVNTGSMTSTIAPRSDWTWTADGMVRGLQYGGGRLYVVTLQSLTAVDAATGRLVWRVPMVTTSIGNDFAVDDGVLYICAQPALGSPAQLLALDAASGRRLWAYTPPETAALNGAFGVLGGGVLLVVFNHVTSQREVWSVDAVTRRVLWQAACPEGNTLLYLPPSGSLVYSFDPDGAAITALDSAKHGAVAWSDAAAAADPPSLTSSCIADGLVAGQVLTVGGDGSVTALDPATGATTWQVPPSASTVGSTMGWLFADGGDVYYLWDGSHLTARRADAAGTELWTTAVQTGGFILNAEVMVDADSGTLFITGADLYAADLRTGGCRWQYKGHGLMPISSDTPMAAGGGRCYVAAEQSTVTALASLA